MTYLAKPHLYQLRLERGQLTRFQLLQRGVDIFLEIHAGDNSSAELLNGNTTGYGLDEMPFLATWTGIHQVVVKGQCDDRWTAPPRSFTLSVSKPRLATSKELIDLAKAAVARSNQATSLRQSQYGDPNSMGGMLERIQEQLGEIWHYRFTRFAEALTVGMSASNGIDYMIRRPGWDRFEWPEYKDSLRSDLQVLANAASEPNETKALAMWKAVALDVRIKAEHCKDSGGKNAGPPIRFIATTLRGATEISNWLVYYKNAIYEFAEHIHPIRFVKPSSPTDVTLPPGGYLMWCEDPVTRRKSKVEYVRLGRGQSTMPWPFYVP